MNKDLIAIQRVLDPTDNQTGGGAASAAAGAMGAALIGMVARLSTGRKGSEPDVYYEQIDAEAQALAANLLDGARADSDAFDTVMAAYKAPKDTPEEKMHRSRAIQQAMVHATEVPLANAHWNARALALWKKLAGCSNPNAASDLDCALYLAHAGLSGALSNIRINLDLIKDEQIASQMTADLRSLEAIEERFTQDALKSRKAA
jgi:formiminotetrahydrofolate cyclodeaminase